MNNGLTIWVIYDHPKDYPESFVARKFVYIDNELKPTSKTLKDVDIDNIRKKLRGKSFTPLPRLKNDDQKIVETWI